MQRLAEKGMIQGQGIVDVVNTYSGSHSPRRTGALQFFLSLFNNIIVERLEGRDEKYARAIGNARDSRRTIAVGQGPHTERSRSEGSIRSAQPLSSPRSAIPRSPRSAHFCARMGTLVTIASASSNLVDSVGVLGMDRDGQVLTHAWLAAITAGLAGA
jgi:hypothetical protein